MVGFSFARFAPFIIVMRIAPFLIVMILLAGCSGSDGGTGGTDGTRVDVLRTGLFGSVQDASGRPLERAAVEVAGVRGTTDENGEFVIAISTIGDAVAKFGADGYLPAVRRVTIADGSPTAAHVILKQHAAAQQLTADTGGTVAGARQAAVTIEPGDLSGSKQTSVTGMVDVYVTPVDPSDGSEVQALTASFDDGVDLLESFGMVDVTIMQGANELDVAQGETLEIRIPAPAGTPSGELPESMPLWSLDEETGRWVEEGTLMLDEATNTYVGEVSHLSAWNADRRATATCIAGIAVDQAGDPVPGAAVDTKGVDYSGSSAANTGEDGRFYVAVRKSSRVLVSVVHAAGGGESREEDSSGEDTTLPPTPGDARCLDIGTFTIEREVPIVPSCVPMACEDTGDECTVGECNGETGNCEVTNVADGTECNDGVGRCSAGECIDLCEDAECPSENECVQDSTCDPSSGECIEGDDEPADTPCGDGEVCDGAGECVQCNEASDCGDAPQCLVPTCVDGTCGEEAGPDDVMCDLLGIGDGVCEAGTCVEPPPCSIADDCPNMLCTSKDCNMGECEYQPTADAPCEVEPGLPGTCDEMGMCLPLCDGVDCTSDNECVQDGTCDEQTGECVPGENEPPGTPCDGGVCDGDGNCVPTGCTDVTVFSEGFESGIGPWFADNGVWQVGEATSGPGSCIEGTQCAGTVLDGNYPQSQDSRLISATTVLPTVSGNEELRLRFESWTSISGVGQVQVSVQDAGGTFGAWTDVGSAVSGNSGGWTIKDVELTAFAGQTVRIAFLLNVGFSAAGWYIDDITIVAKCPTFTGDFESGWVDWSADNGLWQVGEATSGPGSCIEGTQCAGTVLDGNYPQSQDSRLISATTVLPTVSGNEELRLRFESWTSISGVGQVQVSVQDAGGTFGAWTDVGSAVSGNSGGWTIKDVELTAFAGQTVRIAFLLNVGFSAAGWYIDDITIVAKSPTFTGDFESGWVDWSADNGLWQVGEATSGPGSCIEGTQCAGTVLDGNYPQSQDSRLISATTVLPTVSGNEELRLRFESWTSISGVGQVQVSVQDAGGTFGAWTDVGSAVSGNSGGWTIKDVELTAFAGQTVRIAFLLNVGFSAAGWYIDDITIVAKSPTFTGDFESGWVDWSADNGLWQVGEATSGPGSCIEGTQCAGTVLDGNYPQSQDSRLISATTVLPTVSGNEELRLRFESWTSISGVGQVQVSVQDAGGTFGAWTDVGSAVSGNSGGWTIKDVELTAFAGQTVRIAFLLNVGFSAAGWYIDDIEFPII